MPNSDLDVPAQRKSPPAAFPAVPFDTLPARGLLARARGSVELCVVAVSVFFTAFANGRFWSDWGTGRDWSSPRTWLAGALTALLLTALHSLLLGLVAGGRRTARPVLGLVLVTTAFAVYYTQRYGVYFDAAMVRNVLHTNTKEARELFSVGMLATALVLGVLPAVLLWRVRLRQVSLLRALRSRALFLFGALVVALACLAAGFQDLSAVMRNQKALRYLITPSNYIVSALRVALDDGAQARKPRIPIGTDAKLGAAWATRDKPLLLVVVVGETVRAANWGLNGYARQTTPELAALDVVNFPHVTSCGTNTEVSVPCMFSPYGRRDYDEKAIRGHESVLHVLDHGGVKTVWRDNQSGCKGVCEGLEEVQLSDSRDPALCRDGLCFDEILIDKLKDTLDKNRKPLVLVLHQLGNHGPSYFSRYPAAYRRFAPTCDTGDLGKCTREQIVNSYDNAVLYTDHLLARTIRELKEQQTHDAALLYVADHGESLGENGIYLHGLPYAIAPREQSAVPMTMWLSPGYSRSTGITAECLKRRAGEQLSHDNLFHSMLGMMQVDTKVYDRRFDIAGGCHG
jgi:lipid A ethanolaminephosphotransferase